MSATTALPQSAAERPEAVRPLRIVFVFMTLFARLRLFGMVIEGLLERGHSVHLVVEDDSEHGEVEDEWLAKMGAYPRFSWEVRRALRTDRWYWPAVTLRRAAEYVRWHRPEYADHPWFLGRATRRAPRWARTLMKPEFMHGARAVAAVERALRPLERAIPIGRNVRALLRSLRPDVLLLCPDLSTGSPSTVYLEVAQELGIHSGAAIASWDNLTSKQLLGIVPDAVFVWNRIQEREAQEIHGVPQDRVVVTGAQVFDQWFDWRPRPREEFCARVGLDPARPYLLYVAGSLAHTAPPEVDLVREWLRRLRISPNESLREVGVLVRPHPKRSDQWRKLDVSAHDDVVVWPKPPVHMPTSDEARADYYDSMYHCATVVGLNTTAMIEAAIVGKSVHTLLFPEYEDTQGATFHFDYLFTVGGGILRSAHSFEEHEEQLARVLAGDDQAGEQSRRFVEEFVRPYGLGEPATPRFVHEVERLGGRPQRAAARRPWWLPPLRALVVVGVYAAQPRELVRGLRVRARRLRGR